VKHFVLLALEPALPLSTTAHILPYTLITDLKLLSLLFPLFPIPGSPLVLHAHPKLVHFNEISEQEIHRGMDVTVFPGLPLACNACKPGNTSISGDACSLV
jgi:hypothetical protein